MRRDDALQLPACDVLNTQSWVWNFKVENLCPTFVLVF